MSRFIVVNWSNKWNDKNSKTFPKISKSDRECVRGRDRTLTVHILTYTKCKITLPLPFVSKSILWSSIKTGAISSNDHQFAFNKYLIKSINEIISFFGKIELIDHFFFFQFENGTEILQNGREFIWFISFLHFRFKMKSFIVVLFFVACAAAQRPPPPGGILNPDGSYFPGNLNQ